MVNGERSGGRGSRPSLREEQKRLTRHKLLEAARAVFRERGYAAATIDDIVERAGASRGTYYLYFKNKTEALAQLMADFNVDAAKLFERFDDLDAPTPDDLAAWADAHIELYRAHRHVISAWIQAEGTEHDLRPTTDRYMDTALASMTAQVYRMRKKARKRVDEKDARLRAILILVQIERFCYFTLIRRWKTDLAAATRLLGESWLTTIYSDASL